MLDLFRFLYQTCEAFKSSVPYNSDHVLRLSRMIANSVYSYCGLLAERLDEELRIQEARDFWGMSRKTNPTTDKVELVIDVPEMIFVIMNNIQFCKSQVSDLLLDLDVSEMYIGALRAENKASKHQDGSSLDKISENKEEQDSDDEEESEDEDSDDSDDSDDIDIDPKIEDELYCVNVLQFVVGMLEVIELRVAFGVSCCCSISEMIR